MKKILSLVLITIFLSAILISCGNVNEVTSITQDTVKTTEATTKKTPLYYTEYTFTTYSEPSDIQEKIDRNSVNNNIPSKVIITCGEERDVPYLVICEGQDAIYDPERDVVSTSSGLGYANILPVAAREAITNNTDKLPVFHASSLDELNVFVNDVEQKGLECKTVETIRNSENQDVDFEGNTDGRYYMYCKVKCLAPPYMKDGKAYARASATYYAFFIVEITE
ncbi:MAG: hypothetical protein J6D11_03915 [Clostridia bacterium]|nr:hypothetical protein [Clostridia bacterium]